MYFGGGGYDWHTIYNMPIWLRKFTIREINGIVNDQNEARKAQSNKSSKGNSIDMANPIKSKIPKQAFSPPKLKSPPTYNARMSNK